MLFKKNPIMPGNVCVERQLFDDNTVVYGDEFKVFTAPMVAGMQPALVAVSEDDLTEKQRAFLADYIKTKPTPPPRHLGPTVSNFMKDAADGSFIVARTGSRDVDSSGNSGTGNAATESLGQPEVENVAKDPSEQPGVHMDTILKDRAERLLSRAEMIASLPGVTDRNVEKLEKIIGNSPVRIAAASNSDLRRAGISQMFFKKVRDAANKLA